MSKVVLDNMGLEVAHGILRDSSDKSSETLSKVESVCWQQLLTATILWDGMFYLPDRGSISIGINDYRTLGVEKLAGDWAFEGYYPVYEIKGTDSMSPFEFGSPYHEALEAYALASSLYCTDVYLHPNRASDFKKFNIWKAFNALNLLNLLDKQANKYIEKMSSDLDMDA